MRHTVFSIFIFLCLIWVGALSWAALVPAESDEFNGQDAPGFSVSTLGGETVSLKTYQGHPVLLNFFASWCPPCRQEISDLMQLHAKYAPKGLVIIGAATDAKLIPETSKEKERRDVEDLASRLEIHWPITIAQSNLVEAYHFKGIPTLVFITGKGKIAKVFYGYHNGSQIEKILEKIMEGSKGQ